VVLNIVGLLCFIELLFREEAIAVDKTSSLSTTLQIEHIIRNVRGYRVIVDSDLAAIYGVSTKALNQAVKRNAQRFPPDFAFQLTPEDVIELFKSQAMIPPGKRMRSRVVTASKRNVRYRPYVFTEHGALMAANILKSEQATEMSIFVVRAFVRVRKLLISHEDLARRIDGLERKYDKQFKVVFGAYPTMSF